jgi:hypothetical protein
MLVNCDSESLISAQVFLVYFGIGRYTVSTRQYITKEYIVKTNTPDKMV